MTKQEIQSYLLNPGKIDGDVVFELQDLITRYPYSSSLRMLRSKGLQLMDDVSFEQDLKKTAVYAGDRNVLYKLMKEAKKFEEDAPVEIIEKPTELTESAESDSILDTKIDEESFSKEIEAEAHSGQYTIEVSDEIPKLEELIKTGSEDEKEFEIEEEAINESFDSQPEISTKSEPASLVDFVTAASEEKMPSQDAKKYSDKDADKKLKDFVTTKEKALKGSKPIFSAQKMARMSLMEDENLVTETLAKVFAKQGNYKKAVKAYKKLSLKYPEKSIYFAAQIEKIRELEQGESRKKRKKKDDKRGLKSKKKAKKDSKKKKDSKRIKAKKKSKKKSTKKNKKK